MDISPSSGIIPIGGGVMRISDSSREAHRMSQRLHFVGRGWEEEGIRWVLERIAERFVGIGKWEVQTQQVKVRIESIAEKNRMVEEAKEVVEGMKLEDLAELLRLYRVTKVSESEEVEVEE